MLYHTLQERALAVRSVEYKTYRMSRLRLGPPDQVTRPILDLYKSGVSRCLASALPSLTLSLLLPRPTIIWQCYPHIHSSSLETSLVQPGIVVSYTRHSYVSAIASSGALQVTAR